MNGSDVADPGVLDAPMRVPFFTQAAGFAALGPLIDRHVTDVMDNGKYSHGHKVEQFERALAEYTGARHVIGVNSGTDALVLLLRAAGLRPGDEVVVPAFSFVASASSVVLAGGRPVFADIDPVGYGIAPASVERVLTPRSRFLMPVHLFCQLADMPALTRLAAHHGLTVLEDSAEAIGMRQDGVHAGLLGAGGVLSFFPTKTLGAIGDAGAVLTDDDAIAATADALRHHGRFGRTIDHFPGINTSSALVGVNSKMDDIQAAVLLAKLTRLDADIARRAELAAAYDARLTGVPGVLRLPTVVDRGVRADPVCYVYLIEVERRDDLVDHLARHGVETETYYPRPLHLQPCFAELGHRPGDFPNAEAACRRTLALPLYPDLSLDAVDTVCDHIRAFFTGAPA
ncbi:DegT/DnrJ/EryC1/StrS aminotransferase family protein [Streptacidiphilus sp. P02-A3a]|uniref:DegT/DnrJ/EryC1/StrS family aminotransferase n=1 Tax=Streptacidiphilus sp. P02-A3a TaxID=2704468 RepID=UPI0015FB90A5|nr:DegT/DnrJ/EryC1/StrS family aminotransferase [Streptacidiphilus sp. P02-A3a]QMU71328.1 DegT/DnrJ/EryC1/StrS family aminotransferase [Streptacidiphilus sp. P02-A3a]